ncbi:MAG: DUF6111 family protein [Alphaproteobacteria bacterium]|nr:DUF6111 family protein [Alphaproteobacteria bacterium]
MFRLFFTFVLPLILPALGYLLWNWIQLRRTIAGKRAEPPPGFADMPWLVLAGAGVSLAVIAVLALAFMGGGSPPGKTYIPPHLEDGKLVPGQMR